MSHVGLSESSVHLSARPRLQYNYTFLSVIALCFVDRAVRGTPYIRSTEYASVMVGSSLHAALLTVHIYAIDVRCTVLYIHTAYICIDIAGLCTEYGVQYDRYRSMYCTVQSPPYGGCG